ncbi:hypothetical protein HAT2_00722 [Candidatus Similichlamydia laticola]|uniref:Uncharacterized protein n=2 Tax=Candidatus Similichlamydia laticola TaxID=2170265 RepID=A0A369KJM7_9BACT|nr:hypothetical protein HAT2_00722 [Candidatus Similichlamydia laticola]
MITSLLFLSLMGGMVRSIWENSFLLAEVSALISLQNEKRETLLRAIDLATYASLGVRRRIKSQGTPLFGSEVIADRLNPLMEKEPSSSPILKKYKTLPRPETARIDLCSTLLEENIFFMELLERLLRALYGTDPNFIRVKKKRPSLEKDLLQEVSVALKTALAWDNPARLPQIESFQPDTSWLLSLQLASSDLHRLFHKMLRMKSAPGEEPRALLYYVCVFRWHPYAIKMPRIHVASASPILLKVLFGADLAREIRSRLEVTLNEAGFESIEEDHYTGLWKLLKPLVMENIFLESCSELGIDQSQFDNVLDFSRYTPPRQEWLLDLVTDSGSHLGWRVMKRPFF